MIKKYIDSKFNELKEDIFFFRDFSAMNVPCFRFATIFKSQPNTLVTLLNNNYQVNMDKKVLFESLIENETCRNELKAMIDLWEIENKNKESQITKSKETAK